jgi:uncharacterized tellurite resistance protein B-like protein
MFAEFFKRLTGPAETPVTDEDARLAIGALLVRIAKADGNYRPEEIARIDRILAKRYDLDVVSAAKLRAKCEHIEHDAPDTVRFTRVIKDAVPYEERAAVISAFWEIVLADGVRRPEEDSLLRMVAPMLGVTDLESGVLRQEVEARNA